MKLIKKIQNFGKINVIYNLESEIITEEIDIDFIKKRLNPENKNIEFHLIYKCNESNDTPKNKM